MDNRYVEDLIGRKSTDIERAHFWRDGFVIIDDTIYINKRAQHLVKAVHEIVAHIQDGIKPSDT